MDLASGYSDSINYGNGYTPLATGAINNTSADYWRNQATMALMAQQAMDQHNAAIQAQGPSSGYGTVGGYPSFGDPAPAGTYSPGSGRSTFSGTPTAPQQPAPNTATFLDGMSPADVQTWMQTMYSAGRGSEIPQQYQGGGIGSDRGQSPNQPGNAPIPSFWQGIRDWTGMTSGAPSYEAPAPTPQAYGPGYFDNSFGSAYDQQQRQINSRIGMQTPDSYFTTMTGTDPYPAPAVPQAPNPGYTYGGGLGGLSPQDWATFSRTVGQEAAQKWLTERGGAPQAPQTQMQMPNAQALLGYNPNAQLQMQQQPQQQNRAPVQGGQDIGPFWQGMRDYFGADPKDQSRLPQDTGTYPGATNPNYQPGGMAPQLPYDTWTNRS